MLLRDLTLVYILRNTPVNNYGEYTPSWAKIGTAYLNIQQDLDELDRNPSGLTDYGIWKARTTTDYGIQKGDGLTLTDTLVPTFRVLDIQRIGATIVYRMEAYNGD